MPPAEATGQGEEQAGSPALPEPAFDQADDEWLEEDGCYLEDLPNDPLFDQLSDRPEPAAAERPAPPAPLHEPQTPQPAAPAQGPAGPVAASMPEPAPTPAPRPRTPATGAEAVRNRIAFDAPQAATWLNPGQVDDWLAGGIAPTVIADAVLASSMLPKAVSWRAFQTAVTNTARISQLGAPPHHSGGRAPANGGKPQGDPSVQPLIDAAWELDEIALAGYLAKTTLEEGQLHAQGNAASLWRGRLQDNTRSLFAIAHHAGIDLAERPVA